MRLLLDTHALYWYVEGDAQLSAQATMLIQDASSGPHQPGQVPIVSADSPLDAYGVTRLW